MRAKTIIAPLLLLIVVLPVIGVGMQQNISGNIDVVIKGYDDGVIVDLYANLTSTVNETVENKGQFKLVVNAKSDMPAENRLVTNGVVNLTVTADSLKENKVNADIWLEYKSIKNYGELHLKAKGNYTNINGTLKFDVNLNSEGDVNNTTVDLSANITIPIDMIGENNVNQLVMMSAFLTERTINLYLQQLNMTFIKFKTFQITTNVDKQKRMVYLIIKTVFSVNSTEALMYSKKYGRTPLIGANVTVTQPSIPSIQMPFNPSRETNTSAELKATIKTIGNQLKLNAVFHGETTGDLEKAAEESHKELVRIIKESNGTLPPGLDEIYPVPGPGKLNLVIESVNPNQVNINVVAEGLRLKHVNLTGSEAQSRTAAIVLGYLAAIQSHLPPTVSMNIKINNIEETEPDAKIEKEASSYLESFMHGIPLPLPLQHTSTATITTIYITTTTSPTTTKTSSTTTSTVTIAHSTSTTQTTTSSPPATKTTSPTQTTSTSTTTSSPTTTTGGGGGAVWTWVAVATVIIVVIVLGLLYVVLKKR